jgi:hypothetical protein
LYHFDTFFKFALQIRIGQIINHKEAIDYIEELSRKKTEELRRTDIFNIHSIILQGIDPKNAGKYRDVPVYVNLRDGTRHIFCDPYEAGR